jgi:hypothetical protein
MAQTTQPKSATFSMLEGDEAYFKNECYLNDVIFQHTQLLA